MLKTENGKTLNRNYYRVAHKGAEILGQENPVYGIGYPDNGKVYMVVMDTIDERLLSESRQSTSKGGTLQIRMSVNNTMKKILSRRAVCVGTVEELDAMTAENKGWKFEQLIYKYFGRNDWSHDSKGSWKGGDIELNGKQIQLKYTGAEIGNEKTIRKFCDMLGLAY